LREKVEVGRQKIIEAPLIYFNQSVDLTVA
jgi:hypothetical protein